MTEPERTARDEAADDANEASADSTDDNPSNGQDAPVAHEEAPESPAAGRTLFEIRLGRV